MEPEGKSEGPPKVVAGRIEELRRLEASERGLAEAYRAAAESHWGGARLLQIGERHRRNAALLAARIAELGGVTHVAPDDQWILGRPEQLSTLVYAERTAEATYHDHLLDLDGETLRLVRDQLLPAHEEALATLVEEIAPMIQSQAEASR
jgi:hypothetical protein